MNEWTIYTPALLILIGLFFNWQEARSIRSEQSAFRAEVLNRFAVLESDMRQFYHLSGKLEGRLDAIEGKK